MAGTVASTTFGVAKLTRVFAVRVLECSGEGSVSSIIDGIEWSIDNVSA